MGLFRKILLNIKLELLVVMEENEIYLSQLQDLIGSRCPENIELAFQIAEGLGLKEKLIQPWLFLWEIYIEKRGYKCLNYSDINKVKDLASQYFFSLANLNLTELPTAIFQMTGLQYLDLTGNAISELPEEFLKLKNLFSLKLNDNKLHSIPQIVMKLRKLKHLGLGKNYLENIIELPSSVEILNISENKFSRTPDVLLKHNNIIGLDITKNDSFVWDLSCIDAKKIQYLTFGTTKFSNLKNADYDGICWWINEKFKTERFFGKHNGHNAVTYTIENALEFPDYEFPEWTSYIRYEDNFEYEMSDFLADRAVKIKRRFRYRA